MSDRSDLLTGRGSRFDIENINLLATLLTHIEYEGYWKELGLEFEKSMLALLDRHLLAGLVDAHWVRTDDQASSDDDEFFAALQELMAYAFEEAVRIKDKGPFWNRKRNWRDIPARSSCGILQEVQSLLRKYRDELITEALRID